MKSRQTGMKKITELEFPVPTFVANSLSIPYQENNSSATFPDFGLDPTLYAARLGERYASQTPDEHKSKYGQYFTDAALANFMGRMISSSQSETVRILDPGAGTGILSCAICRELAIRDDKPKRIELVAYETEVGLLPHLTSVLKCLKTCLNAFGVEFSFCIHRNDFILDNACHGSKNDNTEAYDYIISNPPYFKIRNNDARALACPDVVLGQPNIYALFMALSAYMLRPKGQLMFITPRSFASGPYFRLFREKLFVLVRPIKVHLFVSRTEPFRNDNVMQELVILCAARDEGWTSREEFLTVEVSSSDSAKDIVNRYNRIVPLIEMIDMASPTKYFYIPISNYERTVIHLVKSWTGSLNQYGMGVSTGSVIPFRAKRFIDNSKDCDKVPLLWMQNVKPLAVTWPVCSRKQQYIAKCDDSLSLLRINQIYVLLRRFSAKEEHRRLTAAPYLPTNFPFDYVGFENHLNFIYKMDGQLSIEEAYGISALLNNRLLDTYFRSFNGNTQVSATELRSMPLPPLHTIRLIGKVAATGKLTNDELDDWITEMLIRSHEKSYGKVS